MKKMYRHFIHFFVYGIFLLLTASAANSAVTIENGTFSDVTPSGFSVIWQTSEPATPYISIFSDAAGSVDITGDFEVVAFPLHSGDPAIADEYLSDVSKDDIRDQAKMLGLVKLSVFGCAPNTPYYFKIHSQTDTETTTWPEVNPMEVITPGENAFIIDAKQLLVTLSNDAGDLDAAGWIVSAGAEGMLSKVSEFVGDGAGEDQACLNLSNFFDLEGNNWTPAVMKVIDLEVRVPGSNPVQRSATIHFSENFNVSDLVTLNINIDEVADEIPPVVEASPPGGPYSSPQNVILSADEQAYIFYTTDASDPTTDSTPYTEGIAILATTTLKFMGVDSAGNQSDIESEVYTIVDNSPPYVPSGPDPGNGGAGITIETPLNWQGGDPDIGDVVTYDVYYKTGTSAFVLACQDLTETTCQPPLLGFSETYLWQVVAKDSEDQETTGPVWSFTTFAFDGDEDNDGMINEDEISWGTDPFNWDTDRDGYGDGEEFYLGTNFLDSGSKPPYPPQFGDIDGDRDIDGYDLSLLVSLLGTTVGDENFNGRVDFNADGVIDEADLELFTRVFGYAFHQSCDPSADFDNDGDVDGDDLLIFIDLFGLEEEDPGFDLRADYNGDGIINRWDLRIFAMNFGCTFE
ncbi:MAG: chitobiase/beta-hexosaminidase C-terminal domain-containing protein [Desulfobacterales bacterium]|nr:chitobiase/beta-hexosaminidase C-terminal domain-containing protein [Desulfobacterales bacterium]